MRQAAKGLVFALIFALVQVPAAWCGFDLDEIEKFSAAEVKIERLRKQKPVDWDAIEAQYDVTKAIVTATDAKFGTNYAVEIPKAMAKCRAGNQPRVNQQVLAKGLQHVNVLNLTEELKTVGRQQGASSRVAAYYEGIKPTFVRRDKDYFDSKPTLQRSAEEAIAELQKPKDANVIMARRSLEDAIYRTYALSTLYEIIKVEELRGTKPEDCAVKVMEAIIFYRIIAPRLKKKSPKADEMVKNMLYGSYYTMDAAILQRKLQIGLQGIPLR